MTFCNHRIRTYMATYHIVCVFWMAILTSVSATAQTQQELDFNSGGGLFARMWRTSAGADTQKTHKTRRGRL